MSEPRVLAVYAGAKPSRSAPQIRVHDFRRYINLYVQDGPKNGATDSRQEFSDILTDLHFFHRKIPY